MTFFSREESAARRLRSSLHTVRIVNASATSTIRCAANSPSTCFIFRRRFTLFPFRRPSGHHRHHVACTLQVYGALRNSRTNMPRITESFREINRPNEQLAKRNLRRWEKKERKLNETAVYNPVPSQRCEIFHTEKKRNRVLIFDKRSAKCAVIRTFFIRCERQLNSIGRNKHTERVNLFSDSSNRDL